MHTIVLQAFCSVANASGQIKAWYSLLVLKAVAVCQKEASCLCLTSLLSFDGMCLFRSMHCCCMLHLKRKKLLQAKDVHHCMTRQCHTSPNTLVQRHSTLALHKQSSAEQGSLEQQVTSCTSCMICCVSSLQRRAQMQEQTAFSAVCHCHELAVAVQGCVCAVMQPDHLCTKCNVINLCSW